MPKPEKEAVVTELENIIKSNSIFFFADYQGLDVDSINALRRDFESKDICMRVVKNRLFRIAYSEVGATELGDDDALSGPTALIYTSDDPVSPAKVISKYIEEFGKPAVKAILIDNEFKDLSYLKRLNSIPSIEQLQGQVVSRISGPLYAFVNVLNGALRNLVYVLRDLEEKKKSN